MTSAQAQDNRPHSIERGLTRADLSERGPLGLLLALFLLLPLLVYPWSADSFVLPKETALQCAAWLLLALVLVRAALGGAWRFFLTPANGCLVGLFLWMALSILWSPAPALSRAETWRFGVLLLLALLSQSILGHRRERLLAAVTVLSLASILVAAQVLLLDWRQAFRPETVVFRQVLGDWRDALSLVAFGNTSHIADFLVFGFFLWSGWFLLTRNRRVRIGATVGLWIHAAALVVCWSVHSNLSLIVGALVFCWLMRFHGGMEMFRRRAGSLGLLAAGFALVALFYVVDHPYNPHGSRVWGPESANPEAASGGIFSQAFSSQRWKDGGSTRLAIWLTTVEMVRRDPILGAGAGTFTWVYPATRADAVAGNPDMARYSGAWTNAAHNDALETWAELGIVGLGLLVAAVIFALRLYRRRLNNTMPFGQAVVLSMGAACLVAVLVQAQMNFPLQLPLSSLLFLLLLGVPGHLANRGTEAVDLMVPISRISGPLRIDVVMVNMARPVEAGFAVEPDAPALRHAVAIVGVVLGLGGAWWSLQPLRADMMYRSIRNARLQGSDQVMRGLPEELLNRSEALLAIWPGHSDARSARQDMLLQAGRFEDVVAETPRVLARLNSVEVYTRRAVALEALGRPGEADADFRVVFERQPALAEVYPQQYERVRGSERTGDSAP